MPKVHKRIRIRPKDAALGSRIIELDVTYEDDDIWIAKVPKNAGPLDGVSLSDMQVHEKTSFSDTQAEAAWPKLAWVEIKEEEE